MAKVSELIEQARALDAQGESAKALAIYQHVLPHLEGMPAIKADLAIKAGDLMMKLGNTPGALGMYETAGAQCALHGSTKGALTVAAKIQQAAPERNDVLLSLAGQMVKHGHANHAVEVLIQHAKQANLPHMLQELEPLVGRPSEDVKPMVQMLLDQPAPPAPVAAVPPPPPPPPPETLRIARSSTDDMLTPTDDMLTPMSLEDQMASIAPPASPPPPPYSAPPPPPEFTGPPAPSFSAPPPPAPSAQEMVLDVSPPLPPSARETAAINMRASQTLREAISDEPAPAPRRQSVQTRLSGQRQAVVPAKKSSGLLLVAIPLVLIGVGAGLYYMGLLPAGVTQQVKGLIPGGSTKAARPADSIKAADSVPVAAKPAVDSTVAARPLAEPPHAPRPQTEAPHAPRGAAAAPTESGKLPPVRIDGLAVVNFRESGGDRFQVIQRQESGQYLTLTGRPLADTVGEPAAGEIKLDSLPGDTAIATTSFGGYVVTVRGIVATEALKTLLLQLVSRPAPSN